ncbi:MAG: hypothetical protein ETSY2_38980 [Candidatus Entotheonella gemina]|uniref:Response regulatory domain-containing protein n=1 Tax=Candidatus Entotheonella gemina TaxID=1429439 RepID=W4LRY5_9BACT|nr:MAG: hypothetical protein ETSY2_38980 [Candidatus Entotheonella gemina]
MIKPKILFADNDPKFLETRKIFLQKAGYEILTAQNSEKAKEILHQTHIDLAIIDLRLRDDTDTDDLSGLDLAQDIDPSIPKIILTGFPSMATARDALRGRSPGGPIAENYVDKKEGPEKLLAAVREALQRKIFIGHGHDTAAKDAVKQFVNSLGLRDIVLSELPRRGRTVIELLEDYSNVSFAVIVVSPDDFGGVLATSQDPQPRARQNVIFELGYFLGKLGRGKVCVVLKDKVEIPSNYQGVLNVIMDQGNDWKERLKTEMQSAGLNIDRV